MREPFARLGWVPLATTFIETIETLPVESHSLWINLILKKLRKIECDSEKWFFRHQLKTFSIPPPAPYSLQHLDFLHSMSSLDIYANSVLLPLCPTTIPSAMGVGIFSDLMVCLELFQCSWGGSSLLGKISDSYCLCISHSPTSFKWNDLEYIFFNFCFSCLIFKNKVEMVVGRALDVVGNQWRRLCSLRGESESSVLLNYE